MCVCGKLTSRMHGNWKEGKKVMKSYFVVTKIKFKELPFTSRCIIKIRI